ncbi:MAG: hypothetical protein ACI9FD_000056 [Gammaproteobacteria bacterium]|jgi:hypothetical protein
MIRVVWINMLLIGVVLLIGEGITRYSVNYHPGYYTGIIAKDECTEYPYGKVCLNDRGFPDVNFAYRDGVPRLGYFGDSICYGVGAGMPYRFTDLLAKRFSEIDQYNYCYMATNLLNTASFKQILGLVTEASLNHVVLVLNMNDFSPLLTEDAKQLTTWKPGDKISDAKEMLSPHYQKIFVNSKKENQVDKSTSVDEEESIKKVELSFQDQLARLLPQIKEKIYPLDNFLRGKSFLYTHLRSGIKSWIIRNGYESNGYVSAELFPTQYGDLIQYGTEKVNVLGAALIDRQVSLTVMVVPYEMQISEQAREVYKKLGINWDDSFVKGAVQALIKHNLSPSIEFVDLKQAFGNVKKPITVGEYYVYNRGDKMDWNHPNRQGHQKIFEFLESHKIYNEW